MRFQYALSLLSRPAARRAFGRTWAWVCVAGAFITVLVFGFRHVFFIAAVWFVCVFAPVRIAVEALHSRGTAIRSDLQRAVWQQPDRYATPERVALMVETLFAKEVHLPRLAPPDLSAKIMEAAAQITRRTVHTAGASNGLGNAAGTCAAVVARWTAAIALEEATPQNMRPAEEQRTGNGAGSGDEIGMSGERSALLWRSGASIQDRWEILRGLAGMAGLTQTLAAVYEDHAGRHNGGGRAAVRLLCEATLDYVDQLGLQLEGPAWEHIEIDPPPGGLTDDRADAMVESWMTFCRAPLPAPRRLRAFVDTLTAEP
jgi:hypothetical protein